MEKAAWQGCATWVRSWPLICGDSAREYISGPLSLSTLSVLSVLTGGQRAKDPVETF